MSHTDPELLALRALGEQAGTEQDAAHLAGCADCQLELSRLTQVVELARDDGPAPLEQPPARVWEQIAAAVSQPEDTRAGERPGHAAPAKRATAMLTEKMDTVSAAVLAGWSSTVCT